MASSGVGSHMLFSHFISIDLPIYPSIGKRLLESIRLVSSWHAYSPASTALCIALAELMTVVRVQRVECAPMYFTPTSATLKHLHARRTH